MAANECTVEQAEKECAELVKAVADVEALLRRSDSGQRPLLESFVQGARLRMESLEKKIKEARSEQEKEAKHRVVVADLASKESALSEEEKATFAQFLDREFFTKEDFSRLEQFYEQSWDRLSDRGKDEMSHRVWEGMRRNEYSFGELPEVVRGKEAERVYLRLRDSAIRDPDAARIPSADRREFIRAYETGNREEAGKILERDSFKENMFRGGESRVVPHHLANEQRMTESGAILEYTKTDLGPNRHPETSPEAIAMGEANFASLNLGGMREVQNTLAVSPPAAGSGMATITRQR